MIKRTSILRMFPVLLALVLSCVSGKADDGAPAPQFSVQTIDGGRISSSSLRGKVALLQFWATWCPHCRADQPAVDHIARSFSSQGLVVLAVNVGESEETVGKYLQQHPRACRIAMDEHKDLSARFGVSGYPYYVLIDREGRIAGTQDGEGGEQSLLELLGRAGLSAPLERRPASRENRENMVEAPRSGGAVEAAHSSGAMVIDVPQEEPPAPTPTLRRGRRQSQSTKPTPTKPIPKTVFVLANGERLESDRYEIDEKFLHVLVNGQQRTIARNALDIKATMAANRERGVELKIPNNQNEVFVAF